MPPNARTILILLAVVCPAMPMRAQATNAVKPGDDFFAYANRAWLDTTAIPAGKPRWGARDEVANVMRARLARILDDAAAAPRGSTPRKVADFRASYMDRAAIERRGLAPLQSELAAIDAIHDKAALTRFLGRTMPADVDPLNTGVYRSSRVLGFAVQRSIHGEKTYDVFLVQGGLGLGDRDRYLGDDASARSLRAAYEKYIANMLALAHFDRPADRAAAVVALETALARSQATAAASANDRNADMRWTRADFAARAPGLDWSAFLDDAGLAKQEVFGVWQPGAVTGLAALVASEPVESWKDYLRFQVVDRHAAVLPHAFADEAASMHALKTGVLLAATPAADRAFDATQSALGEAVGRMYAERYFSAAQKTRVQGIVANVVDAFARRVDAVTWMSPATRRIALAKVRSLYVGIGYPERWQDYSDLTIDPTDPLGNLQRIEARERRRALARVGQPVDMHEWWIPAHTPGAILVFQQNVYEFAAALLQPPKYDSASSDAAAYGAIGAIIGHDVSHFVDLLGADYDTTFAIRHWWTADDHAAFEARAEPLVAQFSAYQPFPDLAVNGKLTRSENIADLAGLDAAFDAYRRSLGARAADKDHVRQGDREFFIAFAQAWRTKISEPAMRAQLASNDHAPEMIRVSTVRNLDAWYEAFDVRPGQRLYLEPKARVHVW